MDYEDEIADLMMEHGPDGHIDGHEKIAAFVRQVRRDALEEAARVAETVDAANTAHALQAAEQRHTIAALVRRGNHASAI